MIASNGWFCQRKKDTGVSPHLPCFVSFRLVWFGLVWFGLVWFGSVAVLRRRCKQHKCFQALIHTYETEPNNQEKLMGLMQDVQE